MGNEFAVDSVHTDEEAVTEGYRGFVVNQKWINPFHNKSYADLDRLVTEFLNITKLHRDWHPYVRKGALLAQDPKAFGEDFKEQHRSKQLLWPEEIHALEIEASDGWRQKLDQPFILFALVACCSLGAAVQGWDEAAANQAQVYYSSSQQFNLAWYDKGPGPGPLLGLINSAPYLGAALVGCWISDPLNHYLGRRGVLFVACLISAGSCIWQAFAYSWLQLFLARFLLGLGIGPKSVTAPIYASECAPKKIRGALVMMWQMWTAFGILLGFIAGVVLSNISLTNGIRWRLIIGSPAILPLIVCGYVYCLPESPRWLLAKAREKRPSRTRFFEKAIESLSRLRRTKVQAARDLFLIYHQLENEESYTENHNRFFELWSVPRNRTALIASVICTFFQQFCGVNVLAYYSTLVFGYAGYSREPNLPTAAPIETSALEASMGFGILNFVFAIPAIYLIDTFGRRSLLLATFPLMGMFHLLTGLAFLSSGRKRKVLVTLGIYLFDIAYSLGEGPVPYVYSAESMPLYVRALGMSIAIATNWLFTFVLSITFPPFWKHITHTGTFVYYAIWCFVGFFLILLFVPETKGLSDPRFVPYDYADLKCRTYARRA